jgi:hypothetical protein
MGNKYYRCPKCNGLITVKKENGVPKECSNPACDSRTFCEFLPVHVHTYDKEKDLWPLIDIFLISNNAEELIKKRIDNKFYGLDLDEINKKRNKKRSPIGYPLIEEEAELFRINVEQAKYYFEGVKECPKPVRPILLHYGCLLLNKALYDITYLRLNNKKGHGITVKPESEIIEILQDENSAFAELNDVTTNSCLYQGKKVISIKTLFGEIPELNYHYERTYDIKPHPGPQAIGKTNRTLLLSEIQVLYLLIFYLSDIQRYRPKIWDGVIKGKNKISFLINNFIDFATFKYPKLFLDHLEDKIYDFWPLSFLGPSKDGVFISGIHG